MDNQGGQPGADQGECSEEGNVAHAEPYGSTEQKEAEYFWVPIAGECRPKGEGDCDHEYGSKNEPHKVGLSTS